MQSILTKEYYDQGYTHVVDIDLAKYFDTVNHDMLMKMLREQIEDERVISLIKKYLKSGVMIIMLPFSTFAVKKLVHYIIGR